MVVKLLVMDVMEDVREVVKVAAKVGVKIVREHALLVMDVQQHAKTPQRHLLTVLLLYAGNAQIAPLAQELEVVELVQAVELVNIMQK